jgi:hypothetical protein
MHQPLLTTLLLSILNLDVRSLLLLLRCIESHVDDTSNTVTSLIISLIPLLGTEGQGTHVHIVETLVNILQSLVVGYKLVYPEGTIQVIYHQQCTSHHHHLDECDSPSTIPGSSVRPLTPPNADPRHTRPVTSWNLGR